tara:strand:+ start:187 stop:810 length:624 start_codon:yes stop_codon:yes gene_type:complete
MKLKIAEVFDSVQGEGFHAGVPMTFVRFAGCGVTECALHPKNKGHCDADWSYDHSIDGVKAITEFAKTFSGRKWVCVTGGEPFNQLMQLKIFVSALRKFGVKVNIQTSGMVAGIVPCDFLTVSPKCKRSTDLIQTTGDELKVVWFDRDYGDLLHFFRFTNFQGYWIQPLFDGVDSDFKSAIDAVRIANTMNMDWRLSVQIHRHIGVR